MKVSRRGFLSGAAAAGLASGTGAAGATQTDIFDTPPTVEHRNGMPYRAFGKTGDKRLNPRHQRLPHRCSRGSRRRSSRSNRYRRRRQLHG